MYKNIIKILGVFFATSSIITSCKSDDNAVEYYAQATIPKYVNPETHGGGEIKLSVMSNVYKTKDIVTDVIYTDDQISHLVAENGDIIKPGETFKISGINKVLSYKFNSSVLGSHNLEFKFKNSQGLDIVQKANKSDKKDVIVRSGEYEFAITAPQETIELGRSIKIAFAYKATDPQTQICEITKLETTDTEATINGKKSTEISIEPSRIIDTANKKPLIGSFEYKPSTAGTHNITVTVKNEFGIEKTATFTVIANSPAN